MQLPGVFRLCGHDLGRRSTKSSPAKLAQGEAFAEDVGEVAKMRPAGVEAVGLDGAIGVRGR
jgi:hypothetical protein